MADKAKAQEEKISVVVNPKLDAAEFVAADGRRFGRDVNENPELTAAEYDELTAEKVGGLQGIVKEGS